MNIKWDAVERDQRLRGNSFNPIVEIKAQFPTSEIYTQ